MNTALDTDSAGLDLYQKQVYQMIDLGLPKLVGMDDRQFVSYMEPLMEPVSETLASQGHQASNGHIPFLLVPNLACATKKVELLKFDNNGKALLNGLFIRNECWLPQKGKPYILTNIVLSEPRQHQRRFDGCLLTPEEEAELLKQEGSLVFTANEAVILALLYPEVINSLKCLKIFGSLYQERYMNLYVRYLYSHGTPRLASHNDGLMDLGPKHKWIIPNASARRTV